VINILAAETWTWLTACFPKEICFSKEERGLRLLEEALELAQATGVPAEKAARLLRHVYAKPPGAVPAEVGDVLNTLLALSARYKIDLTGQHERTLKRNWEIRETIARKWFGKIVADELEALREAGPRDSETTDNNITENASQT
jgi:NTP pyrophosphatase (non-canonical NTP hydrolase)